ncbi:LPXTG cell wall anchor domain-containing protein [Paucilactobacillus wasatchensis]|uniref:LPXTG cell wall anchor domain-containing protein n=1 Tax=Paucilactobacillus wasatchensis TaxID=1335616 RepID=UPI0009E563E3
MDLLKQLDQPPPVQQFLNLPGQSTSNPNVSTNTGNKVSNTNHYLPQTSESDSIWAPMLGVSMMTTLVTAYVFKNRQSKQL